MAIHASAVGGILAAALLSTSAAAAEPTLARGTHEIGIHVSPDLWGPVGDTFFLDVGYGVFLRDRVELRAAASYTLLEDVVAPEEDYRAWNLGVGADYHLPLGSTVPYAGLFVAFHRINIATGAESAFAWGPRVGVKYFVESNAAIVFDAAYAQASKEVYFNDYELEDKDLTTSIGLRVTF